MDDVENKSLLPLTPGNQAVVQTIRGRMSVGAMLAGLRQHMGVNICCGARLGVLRPKPILCLLKDDIGGEAAWPQTIASTTTVETVAGSYPLPLRRYKGGRAGGGGHRYFVLHLGLAHKVLRGI